MERKEQNYFQPCFSSFNSQIISQHSWHGSQNSCVAYHPRHDLAPLHLFNFIPYHSFPHFPVLDRLAFFQFLDFFRHFLCLEHTPLLKN